MHGQLNSQGFRIETASESSVLRFGGDRIDNTRNHRILSLKDIVQTYLRNRAVGDVGRNPGHQGVG